MIYSALNNYSYRDKSNVTSYLDWFSTPCRRALGGKNVYLLSQTSDFPMSTAGKVATVVFSTLFFPIAIISIASFIVKLASLPWLWEKKQVQAQDTESWRIINLFNQALQNDELVKATGFLRQQPEIIMRRCEDEALFKAINRQINSHSSWEEIQAALSFLNIGDAIALINHAVKVKLTYEFENQCSVTSPEQIFNFIQHSLRNTCLQNIEACYTKLLSEALQVDNDMLSSAIKMEIADLLIKDLTQAKLCYATTDLKRLIIRNDESTLRRTIFKQSQYSALYPIFCSTESMQNIENTFNDIRRINRIGEDFCSVLSKKKEKQWEAIQLQFSKFANFCNQISPYCDEGEKNYLLHLDKFFKAMIRIINDIQSPISKEQIEACKLEMEKNLNDHQKIAFDFVNAEKNSRNLSDIDNLLVVLRNWKKANLVKITSKMQTLLTSWRN